MRSRAGIVLQARLASHRLPGKALAPIAGRSMLEHCLVRLCAAGVAEVVLATTTNAEDDALAAVAARLNIPVFRGDASDVLGRFVAAASRFRFDPIVRATGDNPCVDMDAAARVLKQLGAPGVDYVTECGLPLGAGVEGITYAALARADMAARLSYDREHVTSFVKRPGCGFATAAGQAPAGLRRPDLRLTVDTREDLDYVRGLISGSGTGVPTLRDLIVTADRVREPEVA